MVFASSSLIRILLTAAALWLWALQPAAAEICFGSEENTDVFVHVEICPIDSGRACTFVCLTPTIYETEAGARTLSRFIVAVADGGVSMDAALAEARKKFGTGRLYTIGNVTVEPNLCRNEPATGRIVCDF